MAPALAGAFCCLLHRNAGNDHAAALVLQCAGILVTISSGISAMSSWTFCIPLTTWQVPSGSQILQYSKPSGALVSLAGFSSDSSREMNMLAKGISTAPVFVYSAENRAPPGSDSACGVTLGHLLGVKAGNPVSMEIAGIPQDCPAGLRS